MEILPKNLAPSDEGEVNTRTKMTAQGIILVPQPSDDPEDPLNWSTFTKHAALVVLAFESFLVKFSATLIAPDALELSREFGVSKTTATYIGSVPSILNAITSFFWIPLSHRIGRRPVLLIGNLIALLSAIGVARSETYAQALACRMVMNLGGSVGLSIGPAAISDMFFLHEKGSRMGINSILLVISPYVGGVAGGSIAYNKSLGWRWSMYIAAILYATQFIAQIFLVPETIYKRDVNAAAASQPPDSKRNAFLSFLKFRTPKVPENETWAQTFRKPYKMFAYPAVVLPSFWFGVANMTEVGNTAGFALNFGLDTHWKFNLAQVGFCYFSGVIGAGIGELFGGPLCDLLTKYTMRRGQVWKPERLLHLVWTGLVTVSAGLLLYGLELEFGDSWASALTGIGLFTFGQEIMVTVLLTYMTECYPEDAAEVTIVFQFFFAVQTFHPPFYLPQWIEAPAGPKVPYIVFAALPVVFYPFCIGIFTWKGEQIRNKGPLFAW
ncbi:MFS general substrate transporter [Aspergillus vadensis CBS 113365]|uniref:MFS general substrate transporter n=1 Tax=Aspergillus vadensis (strain CBS 113365 / IMI 142717 / IBT 24658) TaxID=1448311 RepID=A0A319CFM3_ASPVC|nr:MFS general substrate transporter [Aspergillus vadensis CBS 113365]PYH74128.1 MFS general substrate transporter [Aspergillus vadensis CBS 113365]